MAFKTLQSYNELEQFVLKAGFLPYFAGPIKGYSVEELTRDDLLWDLEDGPWEWKGQVLRLMTCAYGKFSGRRAAYISLDLLPHYINYRRYTYSHFNKTPDREGDMRLVGILQEHESLLSRDFKRLAGFTSSGRSKLTPLDKLTNKAAAGNTQGKTGFDTSMARLQMAGYITIADFEYDIDRHGTPRGWGIARYTTPEALYGNEIADCDVDPWESFNIMQNRLLSLDIPGADIKSINKLIDF